MGQQQLLLIVLSVIIVAIAVITGINMFQQNAQSFKKDQMINEAMTISVDARKFWLLPLSSGGGGNSFLNYRIPEGLRISETAIYSLTDVTAGSLKIVGTDRNRQMGSDAVTITVVVYPESSNLELEE
ncbi:MAG: hypothetical protein IAE91_10615 [Ignavibacteriaceae bacterium]|nr:hypothetical protein [Ignavibacteriaceae bacterium]